MAFAALTIDLDARVAKFEQDMSRATKSLGGLDKRASAAAAGMKSAFGALGATLSVGALAAFAKSGIDAADALNDMSQRTGVAVRDLAGFKLAAEQSGTSLDAVAKGIGRLSRTIGDAERGNKQMAEALRDLGVTARDPKEALFQLADATQRIQDPTQRAALLSATLGKSYEELLPLLNQGSEALRESAKQSETFAEAMERLAPDADKLNDQLEVMKTNAAGVAGTLFTKLVPALNDVFERIGLVKDLIGAGGLFNTIVATAGTSDLTEVMRRLRSEIDLTQQAIEGKRARGLDSSAFEEKLKGLNAQLQILIANRTKALMDPPQTETLALIKRDRAAGAGAADFTRTLAGNTKPKAQDPIDVFDNNSFITRDKGVADFIRQQYAAVNDLQGLMAGEATRAASEFDSHLSSILSGTKIAQAQELEKGFATLKQALSEGKISSEQYAQGMGVLFEKMANGQDKVKTLSEELGDTFSDTFKNAGAHVRDLGGLLDELQFKVASVFANRAGQYAANWIADAFFKPSADGNVFTNAPALSAYSGSVVSSPTLFPFANGIGLMGEAGAEAILPLKRGRDGRLGVSMDGGGHVYNDNRVYSIDARGAEAGVEQRIIRAIKKSEDQAVERSVAQVQNLNQRGQLRLT